MELNTIGKDDSRRSGPIKVCTGGAIKLLNKANNGLLAKPVGRLMVGGLDQSLCYRLFWFVKRFVGIIVFSLFVTELARSAPCAISAATLSAAKNVFAQRCANEKRADCDRLSGLWYCSSQKITGSIPAGLVSGNAAGNTGQSGGNASVGSDPGNSTQVGNSPAVSSSACAVRAQTLSQAIQVYAQQCSLLARKDCDDINGQWYCSSDQIDNAVPLGLIDASASSSSGDDLPAASTGSTGSTSTSSSGSANNLSSAAVGECIDVDGDGWGWNGASCRVGAQSDQAEFANGSANTNADSTGGSGGTENSASGLSAACVDTDGDGWGWNGASCRVTVAVKPAPQGRFRAADITDLVLLTGQSNALGANTDFDAVLDAPDDHVFAFTADGWQRADLHQVWDRGWHPRNDPDTDPSNNLLLHFGKRLVGLDADRVVGFVLVSAPGAAISNWDYNGDFYRKIDAKVIDAINQLPHKYQLDGILWHQGETDALDSPVYSEKLNALIRNFRAENWFSSARPFICGEVAKRGGVNNRLNALNNDGDPSTACVSAAGAATKSDHSHFTAEGLREMGKRYADRFYSMTR